MKRKLNELDTPTSVTEASSKVRKSLVFETLGLDARLLQAIANEGFSDPTFVQAQVIPLALQGKDILACSKTGSGKTLAYVLPVLEGILRRKAINPTLKAVSALILVPTKELAEQVSKVVTLFSSYCARDVRSLNLTQNTSDTVQRSMLSDSPDIVVSTPSRAWVHSRNAALDLTTISYLVVDEADLVVSYGYEEDLRNVASAIPSRAQKVLMSATVSEDVESLKGLFCKDPAVLILEEKEKENLISQFVVRCAEDEKFLLLYVIIKLKLVKGKCIIFVGDIDRSYRLKLYLEQFGTRSCVLNSELPINSRIHVVEEFNKNVYDIIIASDEHEVLGPKSRPKRQSISADSDDDAAVYSEEAEPTSADEDARSKKRKVTKKDKEYGISRGIDFRNVACVLNFDLPTSSKSYTHRIGRTGRAGKSGMALSFVVPKKLYRKHKSTSFTSAEHDEEVLEDITKTQTEKGNEVQSYHFDMKQVDAFRYRMEAALRAISSKAVREARTRELRHELINSDKLKRHFEENPDDLHHLRHDGELRAAKVQAHLKHVPDYLLPNPGGKAISSGDIGFVGLGKIGENRKGKFRRSKGKKPGGRRNDPLKTFNAKGRKKK